MAELKVEVYEELIVVCYEISLAYDSNNLLDQAIGCRSKIQNLALIQ
jgi:hypothetical protein